MSCKSLLMSKTLGLSETMLTPGMLLREIALLPNTLLPGASATE